MEQYLVDKLFEYLDVVDNYDECWNWLGRTNNTGRGIFTRDRLVEGKRKVDTYLAHHVAFEYCYGYKPDVRYIDHTCGNFLCCNPHHLQPRTLENRFWGNATENRETGCLEWRGFVGTSGYGSITVDGNSVSTHRLAYKLAYGEIPDGMHICHHCDNRICIRPEHLFLGTHQDNMDDKTNKDRNSKGEQNGNSVLTVNDVIQIKDLLASGNYKHREIAKMFNVSRSAVTDIAKGKTWNWV